MFMVNKRGILQTINNLEVLYNNNTGQQQTYYSKLALLELCGWIEQTMDTIVENCANRKLTETSNINYVQKSIIGRTYGFLYGDHFRQMLMKVIGLIKLEILEAKINSNGDLDRLISILEALKIRRNEAAHTTITGVTPQYDAPSLIKAKLNQIYPILREINKKMPR